MSSIRSLWRLARVLIHLGYGVVISALVLPHLQRRRRERVIGWWARRVLRILHVRLEASGDIPSKDTHAVMFVANHISWLDLWAIDVVRTVRFISKSEVRSWPIIGWLAKKTGTIFIERARRHDTSRVSEAGAEALLDGDCICIFPEGTTTDGTHMRPFKSSLLQSAVNANVPVWPVVVSYPGPDGEPDTGIAYADDTTMAQSMRRILSRKEIVVRLHFISPIRADGRTRRELAQQAEALISSQARLQVRAAPGTASDPQGAVP